jgi:uncharacterized protein (DUF58 family)
VIIAGLGFAALNTGNNLLYMVLALMLSFLALSGFLSESALRGIQVRRKLPREIYACRNNSVLLEISNVQRRVPAFAVVVEDQLRVTHRGESQILEPAEEARKKRRKKRKPNRKERVGRCFALRVAPGTCETRRYRLHPTQRGSLAFAGFRVSTRFPFGLFLKSLELESSEETLVYPEILDSGPLQSVAEANRSGQSAALEIEQGGSVAGLREFEQGDSMRRIHWRSSLRRRSLLVIETEDDANADVEVRLRAAERPARSGAAARFERRVSRAASEVVHHLQAGVAVALRTDAAYFPADAGIRQRARLLSFLALVEPDGRPPDGVGS